MQILCFTWNTEGFANLPNISEKADMFIFSLQECYFTPSKKTILNSIDGNYEQYPFITHCSMFGLKTIIVSKQKLQIEFYRIGQGPLGFLNKGFIASVINKNLVHINCHLVAHDHNSKRRMEQLEEILSFSYIHLNTIILSGDMNFRSLEETRHFREKFPMFKEHMIEFKPTYKYNGKVLSSKRTPAYCDRIMYSSIFDASSLSYKSLDSVISSDHKPVTCLINIDETIKKHGRILLNSEPKYLAFERIRTWVFIILLFWIPLLLGIFILRLMIKPTRRIIAYLWRSYRITKRLKE